MTGQWPPWVHICGYYFGGCLVGAEQVQPECPARDDCRGSDGDVGRHRRTGERQARAARAGPVSGGTPRQVPQVWHDSVEGCSVLRAAGLRQNTAGEGHRQRVPGKLHLHQRPRAAYDVVRRIRGQRSRYF